MTNVRLNKFIATNSEYSRRAADTLIEEGKVFVNGELAIIGTTVVDSDEVVVDGVKIIPTKNKIVIAFNKPVGVTVSKNDAHADKLIGDYIDSSYNLTYAGRLDKDSEGLILLTNDGDFINNLMRGANNHQKEYIVKVNKVIKQLDIKTLEKGIYIKELERTTKPCKIEALSDNEVSMTITEGLNRQIRRMWKALGYDVVSLKRIRIENINLGDLKTGQYRELDKNELLELYNRVGMNYSNI